MRECTKGESEKEKKNGDMRAFANYSLCRSSRQTKQFGSKLLARFVCTFQVKQKLGYLVLFVHITAGNV